MYGIHGAQIFLFAMWIVFCQMNKDSASLIAFATNSIACYTCIGIALVIAIAIMMTRTKEGGSNLGRNVKAGYPLLAVFTVCITYAVGVLATKIKDENKVLACLGITMFCAVCIVLAPVRLVKLM